MRAAIQAHKPGSAPRQTQLHSHPNHLSLRLCCLMENTCTMSHNTFEQWLLAVVHDAAALHGAKREEEIMQDISVLLRTMACGIRRPAPRGEKQTMPKLKGGDVAIVRRDGPPHPPQLSMTLRRTSPAGRPAAAARRARLAGGASAGRRRYGCHSRACEYHCGAMLERQRQRGASSVDARTTSELSRQSKLRLACRALDALRRVHALIKDTTNDDSTAELRAVHANDQPGEGALKAMSAKLITSQYFSLLQEVMPPSPANGPALAFVNEQVQEQMVKVAMQLYHTCSNRSIGMKSWMRTLADGMRVNVNRKTTAVFKVLRAISTSSGLSRRAPWTTRHAPSRSRSGGRRRGLSRRRSHPTSS